MNILVINVGSSSVKTAVLDTETGKKLIEVKATGVLTNPVIKQSDSDEIIEVEVGHESALNAIFSIYQKQDIEFLAIGHRVVHGGSKFSSTVVVTEEVKNSIRELFDLAPLHNPANLTGIEIAETIFTTAKQIAIFDTAFHQTMPKEAYQYAIPNSYLDEHNIRAFGFHGTSHKYVSEKAIEYLGENSKNIITIHLGNGCSMSAIKNGKSIENSLGFGPMNGLIMGTRSGDIDQSVIFFLMRKLNKSIEEVNNLLQKESGMLGLTGFSDLREIEENANNGNSKCKHALDLASYRIRKFIGSYTAALNGLDAIVFTAGIGENSSLMRQISCKNLDFLGIELDDNKNAIRSKEIREIQKENAKVKILVIPTNEEIEIAKQSYTLLK